MDNHVSLTSLMIVVSVSFVVPIVINRLKWTFMPVVVAEILAGILIGKTGFNIVQQDATLQLLSTLGLIYLLFLSGLEVDFDSFRSRGKSNTASPLKIATVAFGLILIVSFGLGLLMVPLNLTQQPYLMTLMIATVSLSIVLPVLKENNLTNTPFGQTILLIAVIADFVTMILLAVFVSITSHSGPHPLLMFTLVLAFFALYRITKPLAERDWLQRLAKGTVQIGTRGAFTLILFFVALSETVGAENILGAFLAGLFVSLMSPKPELVHKLESFGYGFLIPIFIVMVGVNLDLRTLFADPLVLLLVPYLLFSLFASKIVPLLFLRKWFSWREAWSAGILLSATLSLVIAAATIALKLELIRPAVHDAFIVVAVLTCLISPIAFNRVKPEQPQEEMPTVSIVGVNGATLPVGLALKKRAYHVTLYGASQQKIAPESVTQEVKFPLVDLEKMTLPDLVQHDVFASDVLVLATGNDTFNKDVALYARERDPEQRIIVLSDQAATQEQLSEHNITSFSSLFATNTLLRGLIEYPAAVALLTDKGDDLQEIVVGNRRYDGVLLRQLPFLGDTLVLRIHRGGDSIIPHGDTRIALGDRLLVTGSPEHMQEMRTELE
ncbi:cation:proton antiporter domain-containing protein [Numidum massiliense]|uniref:cation:proton antiporter domain-containing protein n=1 Tax=Numidum massiliense TaxID=1522315 RepID=UPI0006D533FD|nr:cation:proton antiporter [Numidum massiliense]